MSAFATGARVYVDECKTRGYHLAAASASPREAPLLDKAIRRLARPGQSRIHFTRESDSSRREIISRVRDLGIPVVVYRAKGMSERAARPLSLHALIDDLATARCTRLTIERDDSLVTRDRRTITDALRRNSGFDLRFEHAAPGDHALLWVSDLVAWCCHRGGDWQRRIAPMIAEIRDLAA